MTTNTKPFAFLRYTETHFRCSGNGTHARIHIWSPERRTTSCGLGADYMGPGRTPPPATHREIDSNEICGRCFRVRGGEQAQRQKAHLLVPAAVAEREAQAQAEREARKAEAEAERKAAELRAETKARVAAAEQAVVAAALQWSNDTVDPGNKHALIRAACELTEAHAEARRRGVEEG